MKNTMAVWALIMSLVFPLSASYAESTVQKDSPFIYTQQEGQSCDHDEEGDGTWWN